MKDSETHSHNKCIEAAAKLDLIGSMLESMEDTNEEILTDAEYEKILSAQNDLHDITKIMQKKATLFDTKED